MGVYSSGYLSEPGFSGLSGFDQDKTRDEPQKVDIFCLNEDKTCSGDVSYPENPLILLSCKSWSNGYSRIF